MVACASRSGARSAVSGNATARSVEKSLAQLPTQYSSPVRGAFTGWRANPWRSGGPALVDAVDAETHSAPPAAPLFPSSTRMARFSGFQRACWTTTLGSGSSSTSSSTQRLRGTRSQGRRPSTRRPLPGIHSSHAGGGCRRPARRCSGRLVPAPSWGRVGFGGVSQAPGCDRGGTERQIRWAARRSSPGPGRSFERGVRSPPGGALPPGCRLEAPRRLHFSQTDTWDGLSSVKGSRVQVDQRWRRVRPARRAMRSSSEGQT